MISRRRAARGDRGAGHSLTILPLAGEVAQSAGGGSSASSASSPTVGCADTSPARGGLSPALPHQEIRNGVFTLQ
ncbi:hypothetical protein CA606_20460 [Caulobacter vibrioides]|uniref:Uncharacterized protein n=1 Tax=Caulobacter vibrioides TaxID=155892 RepID=A0A2S1B7Q9_CAUVI|nr:hypothetical protein CA606_20460 [Caulobacter vibrioides]